MGREKDFVQTQSGRMRVDCPRIFVCSKPIAAMRSFIKSSRLFLTLFLLICPSIARGQDIISPSFSDYKDLRDGHYLIVHPKSIGYPDWGARVYLGPVTVTQSGSLEISFSYEPQVKFKDGKMAVDAARWKARRNVTVCVIIEEREYGESIREELTFDAPISEVTNQSHDFFAEGLDGEFLEIKGKLCSNKFTTKRESAKTEISQIGAARYLAKRLSEAKIIKFSVFESDGWGFFNLSTYPYTNSARIFKEFFLLYHPELLESPKRTSRTSASGKSVPNTTGWAFLNDVVIKEILPTKCGGRDQSLVFTGIEGSKDVYKVYLVDAEDKDNNVNHRPPEVLGMIYHNLGENAFLGLKVLDRLYHDKSAPDKLTGYMYWETKMYVEKDGQYLLDFSTNDTQWVDKTGITFEVSDKPKVMPLDKHELYHK